MIGVACTCARLCIHLAQDMYTHAYTHVTGYAYTRIHTCSGYAYTRIHTCYRTCIHTCYRTCMHMSQNMHTHMSWDAHTHTPYTHAYTYHMHMHTHVTGHAHKGSYNMHMHLGGDFETLVGARRVKFVSLRFQHLQFGQEFRFADFNFLLEFLRISLDISACRTYNWVRDSDWNLSLRNFAGAN